MKERNPKIRRALLSVSDKSRLDVLARVLSEWNVELVSTGGTSATLKGMGYRVRDVADLTGFPEMMDGRLKTLHPKVHGGLLAVRGNEEHVRAAEEHGIAPIDLLVVNLYPFESTVANGAPYDMCVENIDIGGPAMIRAAAKNHASVNVVVDSADYDALLAEMASNGGGTSLAFRKRLASKAFARTAAYDAAISGWMQRELGDSAPQWRAFGGKLAQPLRYGENPHQSAAFYVTGDGRRGVATAQQHQGKELSYNNINDTDAAFELVAEFGLSTPAVRHHQARQSVRRGNGRLAHRGLSRRAQMRSRQRLRRHHRAQPRHRRRGSGRDHQAVHRGGHRARRVGRSQGHLLGQEEPAPADDRRPARPAGRRRFHQVRRGRIPGAVARRGRHRSPGPQGRDQARAHRRGASRSAVRVPRRQAREIECHRLRERRGDRRHRRRTDEPRRTPTRIAAQKAKDAAEAAGEPATLTLGSVVASDAFFPFADGLLAAADAGATAVIQPGGSLRDEDVIKAADERGLAMVFTGMRHFRH